MKDTEILDLVAFAVEEVQRDKAEIYKKYADVWTGGTIKAINNETLYRMELFMNDIRGLLKERDNR